MSAQVRRTTFLLKRESITDFGVVMLNKRVFDVHDGETGSFNTAATEADAGAEIVTDTTVRKMLVIESLNFEGNIKLPVHDGAANYFACIED